MSEWWKPARSERRWSRIHWTLIALFVMIVVSCVLSGCGFGQIGPETMIKAKTQCGEVYYDSTKDQQGPGARCVVREAADGTKYFTLELGSSNAIAGSGIAGEVARGVVEGIKVAK